MILKWIICLFVGHKTDGSESIITTINPENWLKKCSRCGRYIMHSEVGQISVSEKEAFRIKADFEKAFPYIKKREV